MEEIISVKQLSKSYGRLNAVQGLDLSVTQGSVFGLLGANGAGKSTTIECMLGTRKPDAGTVSILGMDHSCKENSFLKMSVFNSETVTLS